MCSTLGFVCVLLKHLTIHTVRASRSHLKSRGMWFKYTYIFQVLIPILFYSFRWKWRSDDSTYFRLHINPNTSWRNSIWTMSTMLAPTLGPWEPAKCDRYYTENNRTHFIYGGYEGIPENLLINFVVWVVSFLPTSKRKKGTCFFLLKTGSPFLLLWERKRLLYSSE